MNIIGLWNWDKRADASRISLRFGKLDLILGSNVTIHDDISSTIVYEGTIFDRTPDQLMKRQSALDEAFGTYAYVKMDKRENEIVLGTDRLGFSPLYYSIRGAGLCFSTSLTLAKYFVGSVSPDYEAWEEILNLGDVIGDKTTIKEIKRLDPGTRIRIRDDRVYFDTYWRAEIPEQTKEEQYIQLNNELLLKALELTRNAQGERIVLLSGGEDSRRLAVSAKAIGLPATLATQKAISWKNVDENVIVATQIAKYLDAAFIRQELPSVERSHNDRIIRDYWLAYESGQHDWILPLLRNLPRGSLLYDGIAGDITINAHYFRPDIFPQLLHLKEDKDIDQIAAAFCGARIAFKMKRERTERTLYERVREEIQKYPAVHRVVYFVLMNHTRRNIGLQAQLYNLMGHRVCYPYLYYPLLLQSMSLDPAAQVKLHYQRACAASLDPGISKYPSTRDGLAEEYQIDLSKYGARREALDAKMARLSSRIFMLFPPTRLQLAAFRLGTAFRIDRLTSRLRWRVMPLSRMSAYFDWLDDVDAPQIPVSAEEPLFLRKRMIPCAD